MRAVFQLPASMVFVVDAPLAVSSEASPTRPDSSGRGRGRGAETVANTLCSQSGEKEIAVSG